jgi:hypothetical protein
MNPSTKIRSLFGGLLVLISASIILPAHAADVPPMPASFLTQSDRMDWRALQLTSDQKLQLASILWDAAASRNDLRDEADAVRAAARAELQRSDADLSSIITRSQPLTDRRIADARAVRDQLVDFYNNQLSSRQQAIAREILLQRLDRLEQWLDAGDSLRALLQGL